MGGNRPFVLAGERDWLLVRLTQKLDPTLHALLAELRQRGVTLPAIRHGVFCGGKGSASKENVFAEEQDRPDVARRRHGWMRYQKRINPARLVFIDETRGPAPTGCHSFPGPGAEKPANGRHVEAHEALKGLFHSARRISGGETSSWSTGAGQIWLRGFALSA